MAKKRKVKRKKLSRVGKIKNLQGQIDSLAKYRVDRAAAAAPVSTGDFKEGLAFLFRDMNALFQMVANIQRKVDSLGAKPWHRMPEKHEVGGGGERAVPLSSPPTAQIRREDIEPRHTYVWFSGVLSRWWRKLRAA